MRRLFLMCGPAFSGKTVLSKAMAGRLRCPRISLDDINSERGLRDGGRGLPISEWAKTSREALRRVEHVLKGGGDVVIDDTFCFRFLRDEYRNLASRYGYDTTVVLLEVTAVLLRNRILENRETKRRPDFDDDLFEEHLKAFEDPKEDERVIVFKTDDNKDEWLDANIL